MKRALKILTLAFGSAVAMGLLSHWIVLVTMPGRTFPDYGTYYCVVVVFLQTLVLGPRFIR